MIKNVFLIITIVLISFSLKAQNKYWQQEVNYTINVSLDEKTHSINAFESIEYVNNSTTTLTYLYFHLWPNAYKNNSTALAKQFLASKETKFHFSKKKERGYIDNLDFKVNGEIVNWNYLKDSIDICKIVLNKPLRPGDKINITTPFYVKIPSSKFSRLGHADNQYQLTQWYPKPAVFDKNGWNQMPYLNKGEFYSEFGSFKVNITLPKAYVVGASGNLLNEGEKIWLDSLAHSKKSGKDLIDTLNKNSTKTLSYELSNVHDFAWFCDKTYYVEKSEVLLPNGGNKVTTYVLYNDKNKKLWKGATQYLNRAIESYSKWNGNYPYTIATAVDGALSAGGGMEYPTITIIGGVSSKELLDEVITHEIGHNWFYGILGTNERNHGWMDEGINSFNEMRYMMTYYKDEALVNAIGIPEKIASRLKLDQLLQTEYYKLGYLTTAKNNTDQAMETKSQDFTDLNYGGIMYCKSAVVFRKLYDYLGEELFDKCFHAYFDNWKFKHPQPEDLKNIFETTSGKNLDWLFKDIINTNKKIDYKVKSYSAKNGLVVKNKSSISVPFTINYYKADSIYKTQSVAGFLHKKAITVIDNDFEKITIDNPKTSIDINFHNNVYFKNGKFRKKYPVKFGLLNLYNAPEKINLSWCPIAGFNYYDKLMVGVYLSNAIIPSSKLKFQLLPMYAIGSKQIVGSGNIQYHIQPLNIIKDIEIGVTLKRFSDLNFDKRVFENLKYVYSQPFLVSSINKVTYNKIAPYLKIKLPTIKRSTQSLLLTYNNIIINNLAYKNIHIPQLQYTISNNRTINNLDFTLDLQQYNESTSAKYKTRLSSTLNYKYQYKNKKHISIRLFAGKLFNDNLISALNFDINGQNDYLYIQTMLARNGTNAWLGNNQLALTDGGFRNTMSYYLFDNTFISKNITIDIPKTPLAIYSDVAWESRLNNIFINTGISVNLFKSIVEVYFPLYNNAYPEQLSYAERINIRLNFDLMNPLKQLENLF